MANTVQLKKDGQIVYPITDRSCIIGLEEGPVMSCRYAWDGTTTPDVTKIPAGVTVEYNSNTYTGTLAASASTVGYQYLVYNPTSTEFDRYATDATGGSYAWKPMGDTTIQSPDIADNLTTNDPTKALSAKQGKILNEEVEGLEAKVDGKKNAITGWNVGYINTSQGVGNTCPKTVTGNSSWDYVIVSVVAGWRYIVNGVGGSAPRLWCFLDAEDKILSAADASVSASDDSLVLTPPETATQLIINSSNDATCYAYYKGLISEIEEIEQSIGVIGDDVEELNTKLNGNERAIQSLNFNPFENYVLEIGYRYYCVANSTIYKYPNSSFKCALISVTPGDIFTIKGDNKAGNYPLYAFADNNNVCLKRSSVPDLEFSGKNVVLIPNGVSKLVVNFDTTLEQNCYVVRGLLESNEFSEKLNSINDFSDISSLSKSAQQYCFFHDNFHRPLWRTGITCVSGRTYLYNGLLYKCIQTHTTGDTFDAQYFTALDAWDIASNSYSSQYPMAYTNTKDGDDGFRIVDDTLINSNEASGIGIKLISGSMPLSDNFFIELATPDDGYRETVVFNYKGDNDYIALELRRIGGTFQITPFVGDVQAYQFVSNVNFSSTMICLQYSHGRMRIFIGEVEINQFMPYYFNQDIAGAFAKLIDPKLPFGLLVNPNYQYKYKFINIFNVGNFRDYDTTLPVDFSENLLLSSVGSANREGGYTLDSGVTKNTNEENPGLYGVGIGRSERFHLEKSWVSDNASSHCMKALQTNYDRILSFPLKKYIIEFDVMFPDDYIADSLQELIFQIHAANSTDNIISYQPPVGIITEKIDGAEHLVAVIRGADRLEGDYSVRCSIDMGQIVTGHWYHIEVFVKEGYNQEHSPLTIIRIDGKTMVSSPAPNCYDEPLGTFPSYGLYKSQWIDSVGEVTQRTIYFDNVRIKM